MPRVGLVALGALLLVGPAVMPWYVTWLLPFAVLSSRREWIALSGLVCLAFVVMIDGVERPLVLALEHGLMLLVILGGCVDASIPRALHRALGAVRPRLRPGLALVGRPVV